MAEGKKSFVLYTDLIHTVRKMPEEKAGKLLLTILEYVNDENPKVDDIVVDLVFEPIKRQMKRDLEEWEASKIKRSNSGYLGGIKSGEARRSKMKQNEAKESNASNNEANEAVTVTVTVTDTVILKEDKSSFDRFWNLYDKKTGRSDCEKKFKKLNDAEKEKIFQTLPAYIRSTPDVKFRKNPETYLNGKHWNDEILTSQTLKTKREGEITLPDGTRFVG